MRTVVELVLLSFDLLFRGAERLDQRFNRRARERRAAEDHARFLREWTDGTTT